MWLSQPGPLCGCRCVKRARHQDAPLQAQCSWGALARCWVGSVRKLHIFLRHGDASSALWQDGGTGGLAWVPRARSTALLSRRCDRDLPKAPGQMKLGHLQLSVWLCLFSCQRRIVAVDSVARCARIHPQCITLPPWRNPPSQCRHVR